MNWTSQFFVWCVSLICVSKGALLIPDNASFAFLLDDNHMELFFSSYNFSDMWVIAMVSGSLNEEAYLPIHMGTLYDATKLLPNPCFIFYQFSPTNNVAYSIANFVFRLPEKSIIVSMQHGFNRVQIPLLEYLVQSKIIRPQIVLHLNHEKPWDSNYSLDYIYPSIEELQAAYSIQKLVIRHYYFEPLLSTSLYLPIGASFRTKTFMNETSPWYNARKQFPLESRKIYCFFKGRLSYNSTFDIDINDERRSIFRMKFDQHRLEKCSISLLTETEAMNFSPLDGIDNFLQTLVNSVFALCPGGNNPETFRLFEALDAGAIPIIVKINDEKRNFLRHELWQGYPAPVLDNWIQLDELLEQYSDNSALKALYERVFNWYDQFWPKVHQYMAHHITAVVSNPTTPHQASANSPFPDAKEAENIHEGVSTTMAVPDILQRLEFLEKRVAYLEQKIASLQGN